MPVRAGQQKADRNGARGIAGIGHPVAVGMDEARRLIRGFPLFKQVVIQRGQRSAHAAPHPAGEGDDGHAPAVVFFFLHGRQAQFPELRADNALHGGQQAIFDDGPAQVPVPVIKSHDKGRELRQIERCADAEGEHQLTGANFSDDRHKLFSPGGQPRWVRIQ